MEEETKCRVESVECIPNKIHDKIIHAETLYAVLDLIYDFNL